MLTNLIPLFLYNVLGVQTSIIGLIDGIAETTASLVKIYSGVLSDRLGKRKLLTVAGYALSTISKPFLYFAVTWEWVLGVRFSDRVGKGIRTAPRDALLAGSAKTDQRGFAFGLHRAGDTAGAFVGLGIAGLILWLTQAGVANLERRTFQIVVLASIIPAVLAVLVLALGVREVESEYRDNHNLPTLRWKSFDRRFRAFVIVVIIFTLGNSSDSFIILRGQNRGMSVLQIIGMLMTFNAVYALLAGPLGSLSDRVGRRIRQSRSRVEVPEPREPGRSVCRVLLGREGCGRKRHREAGTRLRARAEDEATDLQVRMQSVRLSRLQLSRPRPLLPLQVAIPDGPRRCS